MNLLLLFAPSSAYPTWSAHTCDDLSYVAVSWIDPDPRILPFNETSPGWLFINHGPFIDSVQFQYKGSVERYGVVIFYWEAFFNKPEESKWDVEGYVRNEAGGSFVVLPQKWQPCGGALYLPEVKR